MEKQRILLLEAKEKNPMQSGEAREGTLLGTIREEAFTENSDLYIEPIMGWIGSNNTLKQIKVEFDCLQNAEMYAKENNLKLVIKKDSRYVEPMKRKSYTDNFK